MTTIATDGKTVAADTMTIYGALKARLDTVKIHRIGKEIVGASGTSADCNSYLTWCRTGRRPADAPTLDDKFAAIHVSKVGTYLVNSPNFGKILVDTVFAVGAGDDYALGAMWAGASPKKAVELVIKHTHAAGGTVTELKV